MVSGDLSGSGGGHATGHQWPPEVLISRTHTRTINRHSRTHARAHAALLDMQATISRSNSCQFLQLSTEDFLEWGPFDVWATRDQTRSFIRTVSVICSVRAGYWTLYIASSPRLAQNIGYTSKIMNFIEWSLTRVLRVENCAICNFQINKVTIGVRCNFHIQFTPCFQGK